MPTLQALHARGYGIPLVITQPDRPAGRGRGVTPTPIAIAAEALGLPVLRTENINAETLPPADLMVVIAFGQKIAAAVVNAPRLGAINLHGSRLPRYRGAAPINWAIISGETIAGNSIIRLADRMDAGAVLGMSSIAINPVETAGELHDRLSLDGVDLVLRVVGELQSGQAVEVEQDHALATIAPKLNREKAVLDWTRGADEIARRIRGLSPWPGCRVKVIDANGKTVGMLRLVRAQAVDESDAARSAGGIADGHEPVGRLAGADFRRGDDRNRPRPGGHSRSAARWKTGDAVGGVPAWKSLAGRWIFRIHLTGRSLISDCRIEWGWASDLQR